MGSQVPYYYKLGFSLCFLQARQTLEFYSCTSEEIDHEDITKDKTSTIEACLPLELTTVWMIFLQKHVIQLKAVCQSHFLPKNVHVAGLHHHGTLTGPTSKLDFKKKL